MSSIVIENRQEFVAFLDSFARVSESFIIDIQQGNINVTCTSSDNTLILYGEYDVKNEFIGRLCIPNGKRLVSLLSSINSTDLNLSISTNTLSYKGGGISFKYHLVDEDWIKPPALKVDRIKNFEYDVIYDITVEAIQGIIKSSSFVPETDRLYLYTEDNTLKCELTDRTKDNTDSYVISLYDNVYKPLPISFSLRMDALRLMNIQGLQHNTTINFNTEISVLSIKGGSQNSSLIYILTTYGT